MRPYRAYAERKYAHCLAWASGVIERHVPDRSSVAEFGFPALFDSDTAQILAFAWQIDRSQWWPPEQMEAHQFRQLGLLVAHARRHVPFYADRLRDLPADFERSLDAARWRELPRLTREEARRAGATLRSTRPPPLGDAAVWSTSGSTGIPLTLYPSAAWWQLMGALRLRYSGWHGYDPRGKLVEIRPLRAGDPRGAVLRGMRWDPPHGEMFNTGAVVWYDIFSDISAQAALLEREAPDYLHTHPGNLRLLLRAFRRENRKLPNLKLVRTEAEQLDPDLRAECREVWGAKLIDFYGAREFGYIALQCPESDRYHIQSELGLVEVLRADGSPCAPGETGRVAITPLHGFNLPLIRYELGDYAEVGEPCPCGRGLPVLRRILGREKALLTLPNGEKRYATFGSRVFGHLDMVRQFQIAQTGRTAIEARIAADRALTEGEQQAIVAGLGKQLGPGFRIALRFVDAIALTPGGKYMEFVSELPDA